LLGHGATAKRRAAGDDDARRLAGGVGVDDLNLVRIRRHALFLHSRGHNA
jgi:hypothetical protein